MKMVLKHQRHGQTVVINVEWVRMFRIPVVGGTSGGACSIIKIKS